MERRGEKEEERRWRSRDSRKLKSAAHSCPAKRKGVEPLYLSMANCEREERRVVSFLPFRIAALISDGKEHLINSF